jgi:hypothetical protein
LRRSSSFSMVSTLSARKRIGCLLALISFLYPVRDAVLAKAQLAAGQTLLDVGTGRPHRVRRPGATAPSGRDLLRYLRGPACGLPRGSHLRGPALIYVNDKARVLREFYRVLKLAQASEITRHPQPLAEMVPTM